MLIKIGTLWLPDYKKIKNIFVCKKLSYVGKDLFYLEKKRLKNITFYSLDSFLPYHVTGEHIGSIKNCITVYEYDR